MAAITATDAVVNCPAGAVTTVAPALATRVAGAIQNQSRTTSILMRLGADPDANNGCVIVPGEIITYGAIVPGQGQTTDTYQGDVRVFNPGPDAVRVFRIEGEVP